MVCNSCLICFKPLHYTAGSSFRCKCVLNIEQINNREPVQAWRKMKQTATMAESEAPRGWRCAGEVIYALRMNPKIRRRTILIRLSTEEMLETCPRRVPDISSNIRERRSSRILVIFYAGSTSTVPRCWQKRHLNVSNLDKWNQKKSEFFFLSEWKLKTLLVLC